MGSHHVGKFACVLLGIFGVVIARDNCTSFGQIQSLDETCRIRPLYAGPPSVTAMLRLRCSSQDIYRTCMEGMIEDCPHKERIRAEIEGYLGLCNGQNGVSAWAEKHLAPFDTPDLSCLRALSLDKSNESCKEELKSMARNFPYRNETLNDGLASVKRLKRAVFDCFKVTLQEGLRTDEYCKDRSWRKEYMTVMILITLGGDIFGLNLDEHDRLEIEDLQNEGRLEQILFPGFS